jgi:hypothetical protein
VLAFETFGGYSSDTSNLIGELAEKSRVRLAVDLKTARRYIHTRLSVILQRQNARAILARNPDRYRGLDVSGLA